MKNDLKVNLCEYCRRCRFGCGKKDSSERIFFCKFAERHSYSIPICAHYRWHWRFFVPRTKKHPFKALFNFFKRLILLPFTLVKKLVVYIKAKRNLRKESEVNDESQK